MPTNMDIAGGHLVVTDCAGSISLDGGSLDATNYTASDFNVNMGGVAILANPITNVDMTVAGGGSLTVPGIANGLDETLTLKDASSSVTVASLSSVNAGFLDITGGTLTAQSGLFLDGGTDTGGNPVGGGNWMGADTFVSVAGTLAVGAAAVAPGFSLSVMGGAVISCGKGLVGNDAGSSGNVTMSNAGTIWSCGQGLTLGLDGNGELDIDTGAQLQFDGEAAFVVGFDSGSQGKLRARAKSP